MIRGHAFIRDYKHILQIFIIEQKYALHMKVWMEKQDV